MWCKMCQQDVPGLPAATPGAYSCPRCKAVLRDGETSPVDETRTEQAPPQTASCPSEPVPAPDYDGWELEERLRHVERLLKLDQPHGPQREAGGERELFRVDAPNAGPTHWHYPAAARAKASRKRTLRASWTESWLPLMTWAVLALGLMASACSGVLLGWGAFCGRDDLWAIGVPIGLGSQIVLIVGLVLQLDRLWHDNRDTAQKLDHVDERLHALNQTTSLLGATHGSASSPFHLHMAGGASPQLLLADLKSQLDLLALKLGQEER
jgi:hypothetical protein